MNFLLKLIISTFFYYKAVLPFILLLFFISGCGVVFASTNNGAIRCLVITYVIALFIWKNTMTMAGNLFLLDFCLFFFCLLLSRIFRNYK